MSRPALGAETEIALAAIDVNVDVTVAESPYPTIVGAFEIITCTKTIEFAPSSDQNKFLPNGYNPAAQVIPARGGLGSLSFEGLDFAATNRAMAYNGELCVARLITRIDDFTVRTLYCNYYTPTITVRAPEGDEVGTVSAQGAFAYEELV